MAKERRDRAGDMWSTDKVSISSLHNGQLGGRRLKRREN